MTKVYAWFAALAIALSAVVGLYLWGREGHKSAQEAQELAKSRATQLEQANGALRAYARNAEIERAATAKRLQAAQARVAKAEKDNKDLQDALKANPDWADMPIPDSVRDALDS